MATTKVNKSAKTGQFISDKDIKNKPATTYEQTVTKKTGTKKK